MPEPIVIPITKPMELQKPRRRLSRSPDVEVVLMGMAGDKPTRRKAHVMLVLRLCRGREIVWRGPEPDGSRRSPPLQAVDGSRRNPDEEGVKSCAGISVMRRGMARTIGLLTFAAAMLLATLSAQGQLGPQGGPTNRNTNPPPGVTPLPVDLFTSKN